jgi:tetratricopeptide (TPR) repeat protein
MPPRQLKGFSTEVRAWRALARNTHQSRFAARNRTSLASPLIGRESELALLLRCWRRAKAGRGQVVLISGEPGIGKSRLVAELEARVASSAVFTTEVQDQIVRRADGVPLFIEELTRTVLQREPDRYGEVRVALPETLQSALMARLDRLPAAKEVAQIGAVLGREFREDLMIAIAPIPLERLRQGLDQLIGSGLAERRAEGTSAVCVFKHALVQDAAYESLLRSRRAAIHGLVAQRLAQSTEVLGGDPEILARHYAGAGLTDKAVVSWLRAAELAMSRWAHLEAIAHLKAALAVIEADAQNEVPPPISLDLWLRLADSLLEARGYGLQETADAYQRAMEIARTIAAEAPLFAALVGLSNFHLHRGDAETGLQISRELVERASRAGDAAAEAAGHRLVGATYLFRGDFPAARRCFEQALEKYDLPSEGPLLTSHRYNQRVSCRYYLSQTLLPMGLEAEALDYCRDALEIAGTSAFPSHVALALDGYCSLHQHCREWDDLACQGEELIRLASDKRLPFWLSLGEVSHGLALANQGMADAGIKQIERGVERYQGTSATRALPFLLGSLAAAYEVAGDLAQASSVLDKALSTARELGHRAEGELTRLHGELALLESHSRADLAENRFRKALRYSACSIRQDFRTARRALPVGS